MKKIILFIFIILGIFISWFVYVTEIRATNISQYVNPTNNYTILFQEVGEPEFPFGKTDVKITLLSDKKKKVDTITTYIKDDGGHAKEENISIKWFENYVEVTLLGSEQQNDIHKIYYN